MTLKQSEILKKRLYIEGVEKLRNLIVVMDVIKKIAAEILQRPAAVFVNAGLLCNMKHI
jgi:hypothetical protein